MKVLTVDFDLVAQSMRDVSRESSEYFLNKNTGAIISLSRSLLKSLSDESTGERATLPDWDQKMIPVARDIVLKGSEEYIRIPESFGRPHHKWMNEFTKDVRSQKLRQKLQAALKGRGSAKRFKEILKQYPDERRVWTMFSTNCWKQRIQTWLESHCIIAVEKNPNKPRASAR